MSNLLICDIDGVLADCSHRLHYLQEKDYDAFYANENLVKDKPIIEGIDLTHALKALNGSYIILLTGRPERTRRMTEMWLENNMVFYDRLLMREDGDYRPSPKVKTELLFKNMPHNMGFNPYFLGYFIDDDPKNVKAVCKAFPDITGITFGIERMKR